MKTNMATDNLQSQRLLCCGVSADTADMSWRTILCPGDDEPWADPQLSVLPYSAAKDIYGDDYIEPAWSLSRLLGLLPKLVFDKNHEGFYFSLAKECASSADYNAAYKPCWTEETDNLIEKRAPCPIEACVQLIEWLTSNGYKLNGQ